ncbi:hypothetical protein POPTR_T002868v4 [Populus trichocarpa]|uniref:Uncharacterized protein n=2 Tax=Populus trichocarpa TaxID=3694 RepID=A0ACC0RI00_POPTR|nr:hypothetical protein POPTR_T002668v4 [Populus trichocarpa]KAI9215659.1 hypothetical protein POPTR_T002868v4 [Populus trichocarpa]
MLAALLDDFRLMFLWFSFCSETISRIILLTVSCLLVLSFSVCSSPFYKPSRLPPISPAFAGLLSSTNEIVGERRGPRLD